MNKNEKPFRGSTPVPDHIMISFYDDAKTTMAVTWRTSTDCICGYVLYREDGSDEIMRQDAYFEEFDSDIDESNVFWCRLKGLKPDTKYFYNCGSDENRCGDFSFKTEPENLTKFKFLCISDHQKGGHDVADYSELNVFLKKVLNEHPDARFILTAGDNTDCGQHEVQWNGLFAGLSGVCESIPMMMALGNHDNRGFADYATGTGRYYSEPAEFFGKQFKGSYPDNGAEGWKTENYIFNYGNTLIGVVGINGPEDVNDWLIDTLSKNKQTWKLGAYHFPICYSGTDCENYDVLPVMREGMELFDLVFSGHEHNFARSFPLKNEELFDKPSQGTIQYMCGNGNRNPPGSRTVPKIWHTAFYPQEDEVSCVCVVEIDGDVMTLTSVLEDGRIIDKCIVDKAKDEILPYSSAPMFNRTRMMFKGMDLGLCQVEVPCEQKDEIWCCAMATLIQYIGGYVEKTAGKTALEIYGHKVVFTEGSDIAMTEKGEFKLPCAVYRNMEEKNRQLYIPADGCEAFGMRWAYSKRNNFLSFEHMSEDHPLTVQP